MVAGLRCHGGPPALRFSCETVSPRPLFPVDGVSMTKRTVGVALVALMVWSSGGSTRAAGGAAPLVDAVRKKDAAAIRMLLKQPGAATVASADGTTPLHWATDLDDLATAQLLVRAGADVKSKNRYGVTPLYSAAVNGNAAMNELLLRAGADPNVPLPEGET